MKIKTLVAATVFATSMPFSASAQDVLTGDTRLACEAVLCLAAPTRPGECAASIAKYFSISLRRFSQTLRARRNFLSLCPRVDSGTVEQIINTYPPEPDPPEPPAPIPPGAPATRAEIEARLAYLVPAFEQKAAQVSNLRAALDSCIAQYGRVEDGFCGPESSNYSNESSAAQAMNEEIARLQNVLSTL